MRLAAAIACAALLIGLAVRPGHTETRVALIVGNSAYRYVGALANPANDAKLIANTLRELGFSLIGGGAQIDLDKASFEEALQKFGDSLIGADVALFYYAGHGLQLGGANYLIPINANPAREADVPLQMVNANIVLGQMESSGTRLNLMILDACRNNPLAGRSLRATGAGLAQMSAPEGTLISFATQPGNAALDGVDGHSPYTKALAQTVRRPGLGLFDTFNEVGLAVQQATGGTQKPWMSNSPIKGSFNFATPSAAPGPGAAAAAPPALGDAERAWGASKTRTAWRSSKSFAGSTPAASTLASRGRASMSFEKHHRPPSPRPGRPWARRRSRPAFMIRSAPSEHSTWRWHAPTAKRRPRWSFPRSKARDPSTRRRSGSSFRRCANRSRS